MEYTEGKMNSLDKELFVAQQKQIRQGDYGFQLVLEQLIEPFTFKRNHP